LERNRARVYSRSILDGEYNSGQKRCQQFDTINAVGFGKSIFQYNYPPAKLDLCQFHSNTGQP
jgi:hypothetical protein